jgi:hypothetical protein
MRAFESHGTPWQKMPQLKNVIFRKFPQREAEFEGNMQDLAFKQGDVLFNCMK